MRRRPCEISGTRLAVIKVLFDELSMMHGAFFDQTRGGGGTAPVKTSHKIDNLLFLKNLRVIQDKCFSSDRQKISLADPGGQGGHAPPGL